MKYILGILLLCVMFTPTFAHPGNTASDGCHYCRTNCDKWGVAWNQRHCHNTYVAPKYTPPVYTPPAPTKTYTPPATSDWEGATEPEVKAATTNFNSDESSLWSSVLVIGGIGGLAYLLGKKKTL